MNNESAVPMEDLLAHRQWVRALARRLAADESSADDLEQATWLAAVEHPPRDARSLRGWLGSVLRNVYRNALRGDARRAEREEAAGRRGLPQTADELVAEAEMQHLLVREVLDLDEPYRSAVLLRWYEDLTPTQIAERLGVPLDTVKTRLRRAVERLRVRMDASHGGDRRAWCLLLLGGHGKGTGSGAGTTAATIAAGGVAMGAAAKFAVAAVVLVALGATAWWMRGDDVAMPLASPQETATAVPLASPPKHERHPVKSDDAAATAAAVVDLTKVDRDLDLHGVVVRADGSPVAGAKVQAVDYPWRRTMVMDVAALFDERLGASTTTSAEGAFALRLRRGEARMLRVSADGLAKQECGPFQAGERVKITMTPGVTLHVAVKDEGGSPIGGATLWLLSIDDRSRELWTNARATTDTAGRCDFSGLSGGVTAGLTPLGGAGFFTRYVTLPATGETTVEIVSPTGRTLRGRAFDAVTLVPVQDARVGLGRAFLCATTTDGGGRFEIRGFTAKGEGDVIVKAAGFAPAAIRVGASDELQFALRRGVAATGRAVGTDGRALPGVFVSVTGTRFDLGTEQVSCGCAETGADGRFRVADLDPATPHSLAAFAPGYGRVRRAVVFPKGGADPIDVGDVTLPAPRAIEGRVVKPDGTPWTGAGVVLAGPGLSGDDGRATSGGREERHADDLGRFRFADLGPGAYTAQLNENGATPVEVTLTAAHDVSDVVLPPKASGDAIVVVVKDEAGTPIAGMSVGGQDESGAVVQRKTDTSGRAEIAPTKGRVTKVYVGGYSEGFLRVEPVDVEPGRREVAVTIERGIATTCRVLDADGAPLARATIAVEPAARAVVFSTPGADGAWTDAEGRICVTLARGGEFTFVCHGVVYDEKRRKLDSLLEAREEHVKPRTDEITLRCRRVETGRTATVVVLASDGSPAANVDVRLTSPAAVERKAKTDAAGRASFQGLPAREFQAGTVFQVGPGASMAASSTTFVPSGQEVVIRIPVAVTITGTVVWPGGTAAAGASVNVFGASLTESGTWNVVFWATADRDGRFTVQMPADDPRPFRIEASGVDAARKGTAKLAVTVQDHELRIELTPTPK